METVDLKTLLLLKKGLEEQISKVKQSIPTAIKGDQGVGILGFSHENDNLIVVLSNGSEHNLGKIRGENGHNHRFFEHNGEFFVLESDGELRKI